jgi:hypothetical protein
MKCHYFVGKIKANLPASEKGQEILSFPRNEQKFI